MLGCLYLWPIFPFSFFAPSFTVQDEPNTPYPTIQLKDQDWKTIFTGRSKSVIKVDGVEVCSSNGIEEAFNAVCVCMYVFRFQHGISFPPEKHNDILPEDYCWGERRSPHLWPVCLRKTYPNKTYSTGWTRSCSWTQFQHHLWFMRLSVGIFKLPLL